MAKRPVNWSEGMFLKPHHFQAADVYQRERVRESEDWYHPYNWGLKSVGINQDAVANYSLILNHCQARFKDGTTISIPDEVTVGDVKLHEALSKASEVMVYLAIPTLSGSRPNVQDSPNSGDARYFKNTAECADENTGRDEAPIEFRNIQARLLLSHRDSSGEEILPTGFEVLPLAKIHRSARPDAAPEVDQSYVPPMLGLDVWTSLHQNVKTLHEQISAWINLEADLLIGRKIAFDSMVLGDAERILKLSALNEAFSAIQSVLSTRGLHPIDMYRELCRVVGRISIFGEKRKPIDLAGYDHEKIGPIYFRVIQAIQDLIGGAPRVAFEKRYFQFEGHSFAVRLDKDWILETAKLYIGVETTELTDSECDELMSAGNINWKLGSGEQVAEIFTSGAVGLKMRPINRIPSALPTGVVYFEIERNPVYWRDVARTYSLGLRFKTERGRLHPLTDRSFAATLTSSQRTVELQFAVFVVKAG